MSEYCLRWNNHQPNLVTVFSELLNAESLVDVTLATDGHFIHAHKLVLSACSVYFKDLFGSNPCKHPIVFLKDIKIEDLKTVIDFIYRGEVNVSQERLQDVLKTAESLRIKGLADKPFSSDEYPSQNRGQHLSSSFSSQRSSLTDSREHAQSIDAEDGPEASGNSPPASKKRKVVSSQDSGDCPQDTNHDGEDKQQQSQQRGDSKDESPQQQQLQHKKSMAITINDEGLTKSKDKVKEEKESMNTSTSESRPEYSESRAADAMLLLQGSSSEGGGEDGVATPITSSNSRSDSTSGLISPHSQSRSKRGVLQRQPGIIREGATEELPQEEGPDSAAPPSPSPEYIIPESVTVTLTTDSSESIGSSSVSGQTESTYGKTLQVPTVVVGSHHQDKTLPFHSIGGSVGKHSVGKPLLLVPSSSCGPTQQIVKQRSHPELSRSCYADIKPQIKKQPSHPAVLSHTSTSVLPEYSVATSSSTSSTSFGSQQQQQQQHQQQQQQQQHQQQQQQQQPLTLVPMQLMTKQRSSPGSLSSTPSHLRPIQPKPAGSQDNKDFPIIQFMSSDEDVPLCASRFPRAISEEPATSRSLDHLSPGGPVPLTQSVSQDTGLDGGLALVNRILSTSSSTTSQNLTVPKISTGGSSSSGSSTTTPSSVAHSPVLREGPALGCNYCWNSQDNQGRVQRRKTKYHCPACRTNLCIVPCFHEYHSQIQMQQDQHKQITKILTKTSSS